MNIKIKCVFACFKIKFVMCYDIRLIYIVCTVFLITKDYFHYKTLQFNSLINKENNSS